MAPLALSAASFRIDALEIPPNNGRKRKTQGEREGRKERGEQELSKRRKGGREGGRDAGREGRTSSKGKETTATAALKGCSPLHRGSIVIYIVIGGKR